MLAITPVDCGPLCGTNAIVLVPYTLVAGAVLTAAAVVWFERRAPQPIDVAPPEGLTRADFLFAAHDAVLVALLGGAFAVKLGWPPAASIPFFGVLGDATPFASVWLGSFLLLLGRRTQSPTPTTVFWPGVITTLGMIGSVHLALSVRAALSPHPGPCMSRAFTWGELLVVYAIVVAFGSLALRRFAPNLFGPPLTRTSPEKDGRGSTPGRSDSPTPPKP